MELHNTILLISVTLGFISLFKTLFSALKWTWTMFYRPPKNLKSYGSWALITGSTDGIGKALSFELASKGLNLVLIGRNPLKLEATSKEIKEKNDGVLIRNIVIDFATCGGEKIVKIIEEETRGLDIGILINNVGLSYPYARFFHEVDLELMESLIRVNVEGIVWVIKSVISGMLEKRKGVIVNIGSGSSTCVSSYPLYTVYAATKSYVAMLSRSMSLEYKNKGIDVQCQIPLLVATKMASIRKPSLFIPSPETYSKASIRWIGHCDKICIPYWPHALQAFIMHALPETLLDWCIFRYFIGMRERGLRKDSRVEHLKDHKHQ